MISILSDLYSSDDDFESDEKRFAWQMEMRANYILLKDKNANVTVYSVKHNRKVLSTDLKWPNTGELIAGSFLCNLVQGANVPHNDVDIYFKSKEDAVRFCALNPQLKTMYQSDIAVQMADGNQVLNLIYGVAYSSPDDLISHFDIRACSIAHDPHTNTTYFVKGATGDCAGGFIVYNPVPHNTTVARLVKYVQKGFNLDPYQRLFLVELLKGDQYNPDLEITTGYRAVQK